MNTPKPLTGEEYEALKALPVSQLTQSDLDRLFASFDAMAETMHSFHVRLCRYRYALRSLRDAAIDGISFGDGLDFPKRTVISWDDENCL